MPKAMRFVGTSKRGVTFFFSPYEGKSENIFDGALRYYSLKDVEVVRVAHPVATLDILDANEQRLTCLLPSIVAKELVSAIQKDQSPGNLVRNVQHFFRYHGFSVTVPFAWEVKSRYKTYDGLSGLVD